MLCWFELQLIRWDQRSNRRFRQCRCTGADAPAGAPRSARSTHLGPDKLLPQRSPFYRAQSRKIL